MKYEPSTQTIDWQQEKETMMKNYRSLAKARAVFTAFAILALLFGIIPMAGVSTAQAQDAALNDAVTQLDPTDQPSITEQPPLVQETPTPEVTPTLITETPVPTATPTPTPTPAPKTSIVDPASIKIAGQDPNDRVLTAMVSNGDAGLGVLTFERTRATTTFLGQVVVFVGDKEVPAEKVTVALANGSHGDLVTIDWGTDPVPAGTMIQLHYSVSDLDPEANWAVSETQDARNAARPASRMRALAAPMAAIALPPAGDPAPTAPVNGRCIQRDKMDATATNSTGTDTHAWVTLTRTLDNGYTINQIDATVKNSTGFNLQGDSPGTALDRNTTVTVIFPDGTSQVLKDGMAGVAGNGIVPRADESGKTWGGVTVTGLNTYLPAGSKIQVKIPYRQTGATAGAPALPGNITINGDPIVYCPEIPTRCEQVSKTFTAPDGTTVVVPPMGDGSATSAKQPARTLTQEEISRGDVAYVSYSSPNGQIRYSTQLAYQPNAGSAFVNIGTTSGWVVNALAYNPKDNWLYAISQPRYGNTTAISDKIDGQQSKVPQEDPCFPAGHLLQIDPVTGQIYNLGKVTGSGPDGYGFGGIYGYPWPNDLWGGINVGFFDKNGAYWVTNASYSGTGVLYKVDLATVSASTKNPKVAYGTDQWDRRMLGDWCSEWATPKTRADYNTLYNNGTTCTGDSFSPVLWRVTTEDFTIMPGATGNYAWGIQNSWATADSGVYIERVNLDNGQVQRFDISSLTNAFGEKIPSGLQWGKAWFYGNGNLAFGTASTGANSNVVQIKVTNPGSTSPSFELVSVDNTAPVSYNSNGTSSVIPEKPRQTDLELKKDYLNTQNGRANWWITVKNIGPDTSAGFVVKDQVPNPPYSDVRVPNVLAQAKDGSFSYLQKDTDYTLSQSGNNISVNVGSIPSGIMVWIQVSAAEAAGSTGCIPNSATVVGLDQDPNPNNNTANDDRCTPTMQKDVVDIDGDGQITAADTNLPGPNGTQKITYKIKVSAPAGAPETGYQIFDTPKFASLVQVQGAKVIDAKIAKGAGTIATAKDRQFTAPLPAEGWPVVTPADGAKIAPDSVHEYTIEVYYKVTGDLNAVDAPKECSTAGAGNGLFNEAKMVPSTGDPIVDDGCGPISAPNDVMLTLAKVDSDHREQPLVGAEFAIYAADAQGKIDLANGPVKTMADGYDPLDPATKGYHTVTLKPDTYYYLVETKSPLNYSLLAQPVLFKIVRDTNGNQVISFYKSGEPGTKLSKPDTLVQIDQSKPLSKASAFIQVADVTQGKLPRTGGNGIGLPVGIALVLIAAGFLYSRRRA